MICGHSKTEQGSPVRLLRRSLFGGYRRADVEQLVASLQSQLERLRHPLDRVWVDRERLTQEVAKLQAEREHLRVQIALQQDAARAAADELEANARARSARLLAEAEEEGARIRREAVQRVAQATAAVEDVLAVREQLLGELRGIMTAYGGLLGDAESGRPVVGVAPAEYAPPRAVPDDGAAGEMFGRRVEVDAGPFADFSELHAFERALADLPNVDDVHVRRFTQDRADIELTLAVETALVHDLTSRLPYRMDVDVSGENRLAVQVRKEATA
jgi:cell division septum initiation protein DivIVA